MLSLIIVITTLYRTQSHLQANIAEYMGPERNNHFATLDFRSLKMRAVRMNARKLVTIEKMKMKSSLEDV